MLGTLTEHQFWRVPVFEIYTARAGLAHVKGAASNCSCLALLELLSKT